VPRKPFDVNKSWIKLILAVCLLNMLILAAFLTSSPSKSPASTWETYGYQLRFKIFPVTDRKQLAALHLDSANISKPECVACHGTMLDSSVSLHRLHLTSELLPGLVCHDCHQRIDLSPRSNVVVVKWVNEGFCKKCHSKFPGLNPGSPMRPENFKEDCTTCHSGQHTFRHAQPYLSQVIAPRECPGCHGGRVLPWTPLHELANWLQLHGPEALRVGKQSCFKCHDYGFKFCDNCHKIRPPSHSPIDQWRAVNHEAQARQDTRACFTCHEASFCKKCHVNHEPNWILNHPNAVKALGGDSGCMQCHSQTFCSACHASTAMPGGSLPTSPTP
jgi:hypothetical protein